MKKFTLLIAMLLLTCLLSSCGYHNPNIYDGPSKKIYVKNWKNRSSKLSLNSNIYRSLNLWFQKSESLTLVKNVEDADLILAGEIVSLSLPSLSYSSNTTSEVRVHLQVRYVAKDLATGKIFFEVPSQTWTEEYTTNSGGSNASKENEAIDEIVDDLSKAIYQKTLTTLRAL